MIDVTRDTEYLTTVSSVSKESGYRPWQEVGTEAFVHGINVLRSLSISCRLAHTVQDGFNFFILNWHWFKSLGCLNFWEKDDTCRQWVKARLLLTLLQGPGTLQNSFQPPDANDIAVQKPCVWGSMICICYFRLVIHRENGTKWDEMMTVHSSVFQLHFHVLGERN